MRKFRKMYQVPAILLPVAIAVGFVAVGQSMAQDEVQGSAQADPLPSWNDGPAKEAILTFVREVTDPASS
ncbi:MAG: hypothetical protein ACC655_10530, partial [Rhodothermia bacterium]